MLCIKPTSTSRPPQNQGRWERNTNELCGPFQRRGVADRDQLDQGRHLGPDGRRQTCGTRHSGRFGAGSLNIQGDVQGLLDIQGGSVLHVYSLRVDIPGPTGGAKLVVLALLDIQGDLLQGLVDIQGGSVTPDSTFRAIWYRVYSRFSAVLYSRFKVVRY